jgi:hypothetical protein
MASASALSVIINPAAIAKLAKKIFIYFSVP